MKKTIKLSTLLFLCIESIANLHAQETTLAAGGDAAGSGGTVNYSMGQVLYSTKTGTNGYLIEGVQQPYEISVVTGTAATDGIHLKLAAYPNPTSDFLMVTVENSDFSKLDLSLYDISGKLLRSEVAYRKKTKIEMTDLLPAMYFLRVTHKNESIKTFRIIKK